MKQFFVGVFVAVLADEHVQTLLRDLVKTAVDEAVGELRGELSNIRFKVDGLGSQLGGFVDSMDGQVGNLQEQLAQIPGQIIGGILGELEKFNPFRGMQ